MSLLAMFKSNKGPSEGWLYTRRLILKHTADLWELQQYKRQFVFMYGDMMQGHRKFKQYMKDDSEFLYKAFTRNKFTVFQKLIGSESFPIALANTFSCVQQLRVKGELFSIDPEHFVKLDNEMENGVRYRRVRQQLILPYREYNKKECISEQRVILVDAWMYVGRKDYWDGHIDAGFQFKPLTPLPQPPLMKHQLGDYYYFTSYKKY